MGLIFNGNGDVIKAVDGSLTVEGLDLGGSTNIEAGIGTFSGNLNVGGVLTYEDVKNVDSVGIVTAREGIFLPDNKKVQLGNVAGTADFEIAHDTNNTVLQNRTGALYLKGIGGSGNNIIIEAKNNENSARFIPDGACELYHNNVKRLETTSSGVTVTGNYATTGWIDIDSDSSKFRCGDGQDLEIFHDGSNSYIKDVGTGDLNISGSIVRLQSSAGETLCRGVEDGAFELYHNNVKRLETTADGIEVTGKIFPSSHIDMADNVILKIGTGDDLEIWHNSTNSLIQNTTGNLIIKDTSGSIYLQSSLISIQDDTTNEQIAKFIADGACELYHDDSKKFETTAAGITVSGHIDLDDANFLKAGTNDDMWVGHDGSHSYINHNGTGSFFVQSSGGFYVQKYGTTERLINANNDGAVELFYDSSKKIETTSTGVNITGASSRITGSGQTRLMIGSTNASGAAVYFDGDSNGDLAGGDYSWILHNTGGDMEYVVDNPAGLGNHIFKTGGGTERLRIHSDGNVTIGNDASGAGSWWGDLVVANTTGAAITVGDTGSGEKFTIAANGDINLYSYLNGDNINFHTTDATGTKNRLRITSGGQLVQYTTHTSGNSAHQNTSWYGDDAGQYSIEIRDSNEMYAVKTINVNSYDHIIYKREKMTNYCDIEFTMSSAHDNSGSADYHMGMVINGDGSDTHSNFDRLVFRSNGGNTSTNQIRLDKGGGGSSISKATSNFPTWHDGTERHYQIKIRGRRFAIYVNGAETHVGYTNINLVRTHGFFGFIIYEASSVNPWIKIRDFKITNYTPSTGVPGWEVVFDTPASTNASSSFLIDNMDNPQTVEMRYWRLRHSGGDTNTYMRLGWQGSFKSSGYYDIGQYHNQSGNWNASRGFNQAQACPFHYDFSGSTNYYSGCITIRRVTSGGNNTGFIYKCEHVVDYDSGNTQYHVLVNGQVTFGNTNPWTKIQLYTATGTNFNYGSMQVLAQY